MSDRYYIICGVGSWTKDSFDRFSKSLQGEFFLVSTPDELKDVLLKISPRFIFFPHWRWIIPENIFSMYECIGFHMTDLPYGRGGSPLQNLIVRGHKKTKLTAFRIEAELDAGPIYMKVDLNLDGAAHEIYQRASDLAFEMIHQIISNNLSPLAQDGDPVLFNRRRPAESELPKNINAEALYDYIRMLDAPGYPRAFIKHGEWRLEFDMAEFDADEVVARVVFKKEKDGVQGK